MQQNRREQRLLLVTLNSPCNGQTSSVYAMFLYAPRYYETIQEGARRSAKEIVPILVQLFHPRSVVDVGCGRGTWLSVFKEFGVSDILGIDGDYIDRKMLQIPQEQFMPSDLRKPIEIQRKFDLVVSLEVAEHLPSDCAQTFVESLVRLGPAIVFSAAIPFQGGLHHVNEQWPDYWARMFAQKGYLVVDCIRKRIWQNDNVEWWYAQNTIAFATPAYVESNPTTRQEIYNSNTSQLAIVHPKAYLLSAESKRNSLMTLVRKLVIRMGSK